MNDQATRILGVCLEENLFEPNRRWPSDIFEERSYARWAAYEIWERLMDHPRESPDLIIEKFIFDMAVLQHSTNDTKKARIFEIAKETGRDILTLF